VTTLDFRNVCERELRYVWTTLRRLGVREPDLPDVTQEVFIVVYQLLEDYDPTRPLRPWLFGIAYRIALRHRALARHRREVIGDEIADVPAEAPLPDEVVARSRDRALVRRAIERIDVHRRAVFVLADLDGTPVPEIATALGIPLNTAYSRLRRAREEFGDAITEMQKEDVR